MPCRIPLVVVITAMLTVTTQLPSAADTQGNTAGRNGAGENGIVDTRLGWPRVHIPDPVAAGALRAALDLAWSWLRRPDCRRVLKEFSDRDGQDLENRLASFNISPEEQLTRLVFLDDTRNRYCVTGVIGFTQAGSHVVRVCVDEFKRTWRQDQQYTAAALIHEMLHSLGLGENPPSSAEITTRVMELCRAR